MLQRINQRGPVNELAVLLQQPGGLLVSTPCYHSNPDEPKLSLGFVRAGDISPLLPDLAKRGSTPIQGTGTGLHDEDVWLSAIAEGLERYSTCMFRKEQFVWATAEELANEAMDLHSIPRCSQAELAHPKCPLRNPDPGKPIRWVRGLSLLDGRVMFVPAVMAFSRVGYASSAERFWLSTSTGCAAHVSYETALFGGICEIVERDMVSVTWLQQLPLPRLQFDVVPPELEPYLQLITRSLGDIEYHFFDATSDLCVPAVYAVQTAKYNRRVCTLVACSCAMSISAAIAKTIRDLAHLRFALQTPHKFPEDCNDFTEPLQGAAYMAEAERAASFDFLIQTKSCKKLSETPQFNNHGDGLRRIVRKLRQKRLQTYIVDLSTDEALRCGIRVLRVLIPGLQPLSFRHRARFLGHSRLYEAPVCMGYPSLPEDRINALPQPFA